jgi:hypothetical protein
MQTLNPYQRRRLELQQLNEESPLSLYYRDLLQSQVTRLPVRFSSPVKVPVFCKDTL